MIGARRKGKRFTDDYMILRFPTGRTGTEVPNGAINTNHRLSSVTSAQYYRFMVSVLFGMRHCRILQSSSI